MPRRILFSTEQIQRTVRTLAREISIDHAREDVVLVGLLKGAFKFTSDLGTELERFKEEEKEDEDRIGVGKVYIDFLSVGSYGDGHESGDLKLEMDIRRSVAGMHVIIVEDVTDTCKTLAWTLEHMRKKEPESLEVCVLVAKPDRHIVQTQLDYVGFSQSGLPFLGGYGLDVAGADRCVPYIFEVPSSPE